MNPHVFAVVTNWNGLDDTSECVNSVLQSSYDNVSVVIVDNGSTDDSATLLANRFPQVPQVKTGQNQEITAAYNAGIQYGLNHNADFILMLNNDTKIAPDMIEYLVCAAEKDECIGILAPKIYYYDKPDIIWSVGGRRNPWTFGAYDRKEGEGDLPSNSIAEEVDYAWACGMMVRKAVFDKIGLFDTRFWLYYDEVDVCLRAKSADFSVWYVPEATMWHKVSGSTGSARFARIWSRSKILLYRKHSKGIHLLSLVLYAFGHAFYRAMFPPPRKSQNSQPL